MRGRAFLALRAGDKDYGGSWGQLSGTRWYLYNQKVHPIGIFASMDEQAAQVLGQVPEVPALDGSPALVA